MKHTPVLALVGMCLATVASADPDRLDDHRLMQIKQAYIAVLSNPTDQLAPPGLTRAYAANDSRDPAPQTDRLSAERYETIAAAYRSHTPVPETDRLSPAWFAQVLRAYEPDQRGLTKDRLRIERIATLQHDHGRTGLIIDGIAIEGQ